MDRHEPGLLQERRACHWRDAEVRFDVHDFIVRRGGLLILSYIWNGWQCRRGSNAERNGGTGERSITSRVRIEEAELERRQRRDFLLLRNHHLLKSLRSGQTEWICGLDVAVRSVDFEIAPGRLRGQVQ